MDVSSPPKKKRSVREISHLFLSTEAGVSSRPDRPVTTSAPRQTPTGKIAERRNSTAATLVNLALRKARGGLIVLGQDRVVRHMNMAARKLLNLHDYDPVGEIFNHFVMPGEARKISIFLENGRPGIGRLSATASEQGGIPVLLVSISDISDINQSNPSTSAAL